MNKKRLALALSVPLLSAQMALASGSADNVEARIDALEAQIAELKAMLAATQSQTNENAKTLQTTQVQASETASGLETAVATLDSMKGKISNTDFDYGGFIQLDSITSTYQEGKPGNRLIDDFLVASLIPVSAAGAQTDSYTNTNIHNKTSRVFFKTKTPTDAGTISSHVEMDFMLSGAGDERISNSWNPRLRHAFVKWDYEPGKSVLAGQTWSTFFNVGALPGVLDFVGPVGTLFNRQPMIRWTNGNYQFALENPATRLNSLTGTRLDDAEAMPDIVVRYNGGDGSHSYSLAGVMRTLQYEDRSNLALEGENDKAMGYGLSLAGKVVTEGKNNLKYMLNYGSALGRYLGLNAFNDGYLNAQGDIETIDQTALTLAYEHYWTPEWRSVFSGSVATADNPSVADYAAAGGLAKQYQSFHANLQYLPAPGLMLGGELMFASKELEDGRDGDMNRLQLSVKYAF